MIALLATLLVGVAAVSGCSQATRYDVLTFFFTGVPKPGEEAAMENQAAGAAPDATLAAKPRQRRELRFLTRAPPFFMHGPYGAGQCERCHATAASKPFRTAATQVKDAEVVQARSIGPRLAFPREELCLTCHSEKSSEVAKAGGLIQHEPVAKGRCVACHSPHKSARQYMLLKADNVELCSQCHEHKDLQTIVEHRQDPAADCITCHNPHVGRSSVMLKADYDEWQGFQ